MINADCLWFIHLPVFFLHTYFSFFREIWKSCILLREILPSLEQILIKQAYFLVKNGAPYW